jgi:hypothetical protein
MSRIPGGRAAQSRPGACAAGPGSFGHGTGRAVKNAAARPMGAEVMRMDELKGALARDDYVVDPKAVAEAMLRRGRGSIAAALHAADLTDARSRGPSARRHGPAAGPELPRR